MEPGALLVIEVYHIILMLSFEAFSNDDCQPPQKNTLVYDQLEQLDDDIMKAKSESRKSDTLGLYSNAIQMRHDRLVHCQYSWRLVSKFVEYLDKVETIAKNPPYTMPQGSVKRSGLEQLAQHHMEDETDGQD
ncbi:hypothetical protein H0H93_000653 [Arthromyces matolae]|nr:hypothetical protein H0H93_000653 [Arthromyces matolae]